MRPSLLGFVILVCCLSVSVASASNISFEGSFTTDSQLEIFLFTAPTASFAAQTFSYAGGTNAAGATIPAGGFDPVLSLFNATGGLTASSLLIMSNDDNPSAPVDPATGFAFDSYLSDSGLTAGGTYALILSENDNVPNGTTYGAGFTQSGNGNFTPAEFGCGGTDPFCSFFLNQRNGNWAVDIDSVGSAQDISAGGGGTPEPGSVLLLSGGLAGLALLRRRKKQV